MYVFLSFFFCIVSVRVRFRQVVRYWFSFLFIPRPPRSTPLYSSAASDLYKRQTVALVHPGLEPPTASESLGSQSAPVVALARGHVWTFASGKAVFSSPRTGHVLLALRDGISLSPAAAGQVWVPVDVLQSQEGGDADCMPRFGSHVAMTRNPMALAQWAKGPDGEERWLGLLSRAESLMRPATRDGAMKEVAAPAERHKFLSRLALSVACGGNALDSAEADTDETRICDCLWFCGLPACGVAEVATLVAKMLKAPLVDVAETLGLRTSLSVDSTAAVVEPLTEALRKAKGSGNTRVVVYDVLCAPAEVLRALSRHAPFTEAFRVNRVVTVLEPLIAYPWTSARHPLLLSRSLRGWVTVACVQEHRSLQQRVEGKWAERLMHELRACRGKAQTLRRPPTGVLVETLLQEPVASTAVRALALPGSHTEAAKPAVLRMCLPSCRLLGVFVATSLPLDLELLRDCCRSRLVNAAEGACLKPGGKAPDAPWQGLFCVEARVCGAVTKDLAQLSTSQVRGLRLSESTHRIVITPRGELRPPEHWGMPLAAATGVLWWFCVPRDKTQGDARSEAVAAATDACRLRPPLPQNHWTVADLLPEDLAQLEEDARAGGLPDGHFYNGVQYVDVNGVYSKTHPELPAHLHRHITRLNTEIDAWNAAVAELAESPAFTQAR
eukprot:NODE_2343_length_2231_cov_4.139734.p1 GENE.NODE_2343_length_2231_cov_4.139734~~NODE_2343_length_2231_cov_4.139734.p1  ORF type:complete len:669 (+),score=166.31 NODE_2343_length_2231_cov_4.139734:32-2038(+)